MSRLDEQQRRWYAAVETKRRGHGGIRAVGVRAIYEDRVGDLWLGMYDGLIHFDRHTETFTQYRHDPEDLYSLSHNYEKLHICNRTQAALVALRRGWTTL